MTLPDSSRVILACDFPSLEETLDFLQKLGDRRPFLKIGMELFYAEGPSVLRALKERGHPIFLDLKLHDIPHTVERTMRVLARLGADMVNLHAAGTRPMMEAAREGLTREDGSRPILLAVTQLTSTDERHLHEDLLIGATMEGTVLHYARCAREAGLDGVVCSPREAGAIHRACGEDFLAVTPGVRLIFSRTDDQRRVMTPSAARAEGADYIVVGRPITASPDPAAAYERICKEFSGGPESEG